MTSRRRSWQRCPGLASCVMTRAARGWAAWRAMPMPRNSRTRCETTISPISVCKLQRWRTPGSPSCYGMWTRWCTIRPLPVCWACLLDLRLVCHSETAPDCHAVSTRAVMCVAGAVRPRPDGGHGPHAGGPAREGVRSRPSPCPRGPTASQRLGRRWQPRTGAQARMGIVRSDAGEGCTFPRADGPVRLVCP